MRVQRRPPGSRAGAARAALAGEPDLALKLLEADEPRIRGSLIRYAPVNRMTIETAWTRNALARAALRPAGPARKQALVDARACVRRLAKIPQAIARPCADVALASVLHLEGNREAAVARMRGAVAALDALGTRIFGEPARRALGVALGGSEGAALIAAAEGWLAKEGVSNPARFCEMVTAGWT